VESKLSTFDGLDVIWFQHILGEPETYGLTGTFPPDFRAQAAQAILAIAAAEGRLSNREREAFLARAHTYGLAPHEFEALAELSKRKLSGNRTLPDPLRPFARALLYEALHVARADGIHHQERGAAQKAATQLAIDISVVDATEAHIDLEDMVRDMRHRILSDPDGPLLPATTQALGLKPAPKVSTALPLAEDAARRERYGIIGSLPEDYARSAGCAMMILAAADGELSETELRWFLGVAKAMGAPHEGLAQLATFNYRAAKLTDYLGAIPKSMRRIVLFAAMNTAFVDGFADRERRAAMEAARALGVDVSVVPLLEQQLRLEAALRTARLKLLGGG
jgi:tellurite resistance protein